MICRSEAQATLAQLLADRPELHGAGPATNWQLGGRLLDWLVGEVALGARSLETGCGYSTIVLGQLAAEHVAVSPVGVEHERIRAWCEDNGRPLDRVRFVEATSESHLPRAASSGELAPESLHLVLVDGDHAFPVPAIDWYHAAPLLAVGGLMVIDDTHIRSCRQVADFMAADRANWRLRHRADEAAVFQKVGRDVHGCGDWRSQPWNKPVPSLESRFRSARHRLALRRRLGRLRGPA